MPIVTGHPHVGQVGCEVLLTATSDGSTVLALNGPVTFRFQRPDGTTFDVTADLVTDGSDGKATYDTLAGDFDQPGEWEVQLFDDDGDTPMDAARFLVLPNLATP